MKSFKHKLLEFNINDLKDAVSSYTKNQSAARKSKSVQFKEGNTSDDGITLVYHSTPTAKEAKCYSVQFEKFFTDSKYTMKIQFPNITSKEQFNEMSNKEAFSSDIKLSCNCAGFYWQGLNYNLSELDSSIDKVTIKDDTWRGIHEGKGAVCKHLYELLNGFTKPKL